MPTEAKRSFFRIASNYARLFINICFGLILVRILLDTLGNDAWGLIALLGATVGMAAMVQEIVNSSMVRELGEAHHAGDDTWFRSVYNTALILTVLVGLLSIALIGVLWLALPLFRIPPQLIEAGRWMVLCKAVESFAVIVSAPPVIMFKVTERMVAYNLCLIADRACFLLPAIGLLWWYPEVDPATGIRIYATGSAGLMVINKLLQSITGMLVDSRLRPKPARARRDAFRSILHIGGWNTATVTAINLHIRLDGLLMNLFFGLFGSVIFGLTAQLGSYVRMVTTGMTEGIDAVSARLSTATSDRSLRDLLYHSTRLHGLVAIPAGLGMFILAEPLLLAWVGDRLENPEQTFGPTVLLIRLLTIGMVCRAIGDGWVAIMYGAGHIKRYAPVILAGGLANPILAILIIMLLPEGVSFIGPAVTYSLIFLVVHMLIIPFHMARVVERPYGEIVKPLWKPLVAAIVCLPTLFIHDALPSLSVIVRLGIAVAGYCAMYGLIILWFVCNRGERRRFLHTIHQVFRLGRSD